MKNVMLPRVLYGIGGWISTILLVLWWYLATLTPAATRALPSPLEVAGSWGELQAQGLLWPSIGASLLRVGLGLIVGVGLAIPLGILAGISKLGFAIVDKPVHIVRAIPFNALAPLFIILLGIGETMKIALIAVGVFSLVYVNLRDGVRNMDPRLLELARAYHIDHLTVFCKVLFKGTIPSLMTGMRFALVVAWIALVTCETVNSTTGIGYILSRAQQFSRTDQMVLCVVLYAVLGLVSEGIIWMLEKALTPWRREEQS